MAKVKKGMIQLLLTTEIKPMYEVIQNHHLTVAFKVIAADYESILDREFEIKLTAIAWNSDIQAARVALPEELALVCKNKHPHITISHREGIKPVASNAMIEGPHEEGPINMPMVGTVKFVPFGG